MTEQTPIPEKAYALPEHLKSVSHINDAIDELNIANDLMDLVFMAANSERQDSIVRGAGISQEYLKRAIGMLHKTADALKATEVAA